MIKSLFQMHNIKYVVSVDDCFAVLKRDELEASLYSEMMISLEPYRDYLRGSSQSSLFEELLLYRENGHDIDDLTKTLLNELKQEEIEACIMLTPDISDYNSERDNINAFLDGLKREGCIEDFLTFGSTGEAESFDCAARGFDNGSILWLLDRNFSRIGESSEAGIQLAENIISRKDGEGHSDFVYIVSEIAQAESEDDIEDEFDAFLSNHCSVNNRSFIYYISKQRLFSNNTDKIAKSLSQGFKRKVCYELFQIYSDCMNSSLKAAHDVLVNVKQKTLNFLFAQQVGGNGESYSDFAARFVQIFYDNEYHRALAEKHNLIAEKTRFYECLTNTIKDVVGDFSDISGFVKEYRDIELYNKHINRQHAEITTGDVFEIDSKYYLLISQSCDTYIRVDGNRKLEYATLLEIGIHTDKKHIHNHAYPLCYFPGIDKHAAVLLQTSINVPFELLDLCVFNEDGTSTLDLENKAEIDEEIKKYTINFRKLYERTYKRIADINNAKTTVLKYGEQPESYSKEDFLAAVELLIQIDPVLKKYTMENGVIKYAPRRLFRMSELVTADIARDYGSAITRIGHPFDYLKTKS